MCLVKSFIVKFLVGSNVEISNRVIASHAQFPQFRVTERFYVESSTKRSGLWGTLVRIYNHGLAVCYFSLVTVGHGALQVN